jgi:hypothetical protein
MTDAIRPSAAKPRQSVTGLFSVPDASEDAFLDLYRRCDINSQAVVLTLMRAIIEPTARHWLEVGGAISELAGKLDA